jgi:hypothetical protein
MRPSEIALKYIGQTEKSGNSGFTEEWLEKRMKEVGWQKGFAWCAFLAEIVFKEAYPEKFAELDKLFSGSTVQTFRNFRDAAYPIGNVPQIDSLVIWQTQKDGKPQATGHAGIVVSIKNTWEFESVEGNTNDGGGREGYIVAKKERKVLAEVKNGLKILGFVQINKDVKIL